MYITCSRKSDIVTKRFSKYLSRLLPDLEYIPRGKSNLLKIFENIKFLGHQYFVICSNLVGDVKLLIYKLKGEEYFPDREYTLEVLDLRHFISFKEIKKINQEVNDLKEVFYFLDKKFKSKTSDYGVFILDNQIEKIFEFMLKDKSLGIKFKILNVKNFD